MTCNNMFRRYGQTLRMADSRWPKQMLTRSPEGGKRRESPEMAGKRSGKGDEAEEYNS